MAEAGIAHVKQNFSFEKYEKQWVDFMTKVHEENGSWDTRENYNGITFKEIA